MHNAVALVHPMKSSLSPAPPNCCRLLSAAIVFLLFAQHTLAGNATWNLNPVSGDWNTAANWTPQTVPGPDDIATFAASNTTNISVSTYTAVIGISFAVGANPFTFTAPPGDVIEIRFNGVSNNSGAVQSFIASVDQQGNSGAVAFTGSTSTAGTNTVCIAEARRASFGDTGDVEFVDASAGSGLFFTRGGEIDGSIGGQLRFFAKATGANAVVTNEGGSVAGAGGGTTYFLNRSHAGKATLVAKGGSNGGGGGQIIFSNSATGDTARVEVFGNGTLLLSFRNAGLSIGSLEGDGIVNLGGFNLTVGANNLSTTFSGLIEEGSNGPSSLTKIGTGTITLGSPSTYSGRTIVGGGTLAVTNTTGSATGSGVVKVNAGVMGGSGTIAGAATVGTGSGTGAFLAPATGTKTQATLTIESSLTFRPDATYTYTFKAKKNTALSDKVVANGVTINAATLDLSGMTKGRMKRGTVLTLISNTSVSPISGTFSNLADGAIVNVNGNNLQASYSGGDGNDLTLTVVP